MSLRFPAFVAAMLAAAIPATGQVSPAKMDMSLSAMAAISGSDLDGRLYIRAARPLGRDFAVEPTLGVEHQKRLTGLTYTAAVRKEWAQPSWVPFLLAGGGAQTEIAGPFAETKSILQAGAGGYVLLSQRAGLRFEYQLQRLKGAGPGFTRHIFLVGILVRWLK